MIKISSSDYEFTFLIIAIFLATIKIIHLSMRKISMPDVLGELTLGFILGPTILGIFYLSPNPKSSISNFLGVNQDQLEITSTVVAFISEFAVLLLLFKVGTEIDFSVLQKYKKSIFSTAIGGIILPFIMGFGFIYLIFYLFNIDVSANDLGVTNIALFLGIALTATSIGISLRMFIDLNLIQTKISQIVIGTAVLDDIISVTLLGLVIAYLDNGSQVSSNTLLFTILNISLFFVISYFLFKTIIPKVLASSKRVDDASIQIFISIAFMLFMSVFAQFLDLTPIIGAFVAGAIIGNEEDYLDIHRDLEPIASWIIPFFFLTIGLSIDAQQLLNFQTILLAFILTLASIGSKLIGGFIGAKLTGIPSSDSSVIGLSMAARGEVTLIFIATAFTNGYISDSLYGIVILSVVFTILLVVPAMKLALSKWTKEDVNTPTEKKLNSILTT